VTPSMSRKPKSSLSSGVGITTESSRTAPSVIGRQDLAVRKPRLLHVELLSEKILLLRPPTFVGGLPDGAAMRAAVAAPAIGDVKVVFLEKYTFTSREASSAIHPLRPGVVPVSASPVRRTDTSVGFLDRLRTVSL